MSRYIDADALIEKKWQAESEACFYALEDVVSVTDIEEAPSIDLADYVPKDFHDKTCEAMAKAHQEEIADMVSVVRCKECKHWSGCKSTAHNNHLCGRAEEQNVDYWTRADDFCSYGEREGE